MDRRPDLVWINKRRKRKRPFRIIDFTVPGDRTVKIKENEKRDKFLDLALELRRLWNIKGTVIPIVTDALQTISKILLKQMEEFENEERAETIQKALLR